jgi:hypothetical protein
VLREGAIELGAAAGTRPGSACAELFMSKYNNGEAETYLEDVLKVNPHHCPTPTR